MRNPRSILLTGATGFLGQYLLQELLVRDHSVAVLVRDSQGMCAAERIGTLVDTWNTGRRRPLPMPRVLAGELGPHGLGVTVADRRWVERHCGAVLHVAANLSFRETRDGEPWQTNLVGTESLLTLCRQVGLREWHQISTAFVCGRLKGVIEESDRHDNRTFHNPYEESKYRAEQLVRQSPDVQATIYRPSLIVGDSCTGYTTSYLGLYRFLEMAVRLASVQPTDAIASLPLRLPLTGDETWDLVPVDWVAQAIVELLGRPKWHGRIFHLVSRRPVSTRLIRDVAVEELKLRGVDLTGTDRTAETSHLEQRFLDGIKEYWPYLSGSPQFTFTNSAAALPHLPPPLVDRVFLQRLIRFAVDNRWRHKSSLRSVEVPRTFGDTGCAAYIERVFPQQARRSRLARTVGLKLTVGIDVRGAGGGQWSCQWTEGELTDVRPGIDAAAVVAFRMDTATFEAVVAGRVAPQEAFFEQRIEIAGDVETGLKLATLFEEFLGETRVRSSAGR